MATSRKPSPSDTRKALASTAAQEKADDQRPPWEELVSEGVIDHVPEPGADGVPEATVHGHENVVRLLQMHERANMLEGEHGQEIQAAREVGVKRVLLRDGRGQLRAVREQNEKNRLKRGFTRTSTSSGWNRAYERSPLWDKR